MGLPGNDWYFSLDVFHYFYVRQLVLIFLGRSNLQLADFMGKYSAFIWDLNLIKKIYTTDKRTLEIFLTAHNIFNGSQYLLEFSKNPRRWIEAGARLKF